MPDTWCDMHLTLQGRRQVADVASRAQEVEQVTHSIKASEGCQSAVREVVDHVGVQDDSARISIVPDLQQGHASALVVLDVVDQTLRDNHVLAGSHIGSNETSGGCLLLNAGLQCARDHIVDLRCCVP